MSLPFFCLGCRVNMFLSKSDLGKLECPICHKLISPPFPHFWIKDILEAKFEPFIDVFVEYRTTGHNKKLEQTFQKMKSELLGFLAALRLQAGTWKVLVHNYEVRVNVNDEIDFDIFILAMNALNKQGGLYAAPLEPLRLFTPAFDTVTESATIEEKILELKRYHIELLERDYDLQLDKFIAQAYNRVLELVKQEKTLAQIKKELWEK